MIWKKKRIFLLYLNEFNLNDGFENYIVAKIFDAPSNDKNVLKKKYTIQYAILILFAALFQNLPKKNIKTFTKNKLRYNLFKLL